MNNPEKPRELDYIRVESRRNRDAGRKALESSANFRDDIGASAEGPRGNKIRSREERGVSPEEIKGAKNKSRGLVKKIVIGSIVALAAAGSVAALVAMNKEQPSSKEQWENQMESQLMAYRQVDVNYDEDGSFLSFTRKDRDGNNYIYSLNDYDNDTRFESGSISSSGKSADFESEEGVPLMAAINDLDNQVQ